MFDIKGEFDVNGFRGAPVISSEGKVLGVVISSSYFFEGKTSIYATSISAIMSVKNK
jgi:hypothetical protein